MIQINLRSIQALFQALSIDDLKQNWTRLHNGDCEPWPDSPELQQAWLAFHNGDFLMCAEMSEGQAGFETVRLKALSTYAHYLEYESKEKISRLMDVVTEAEAVISKAETYPANVHYQLAYALGRYGLFISIAKAMSEGIAGRIANALHTCLQLEPNHADAHTALAKYQAEIIGKLGKMAGRLTYGVSADDALAHYQKGVTLAPDSISAKTEYADGLITLFGRKKQPQAIELYEAAVSQPPLDVLEALDYYLAQQELAEVS